MRWVTEKNINTGNTTTKRHENNSQQILEEIHQASEVNIDLNVLKT